MTERHEPTAGDTATGTRHEPEHDVVVIEHDPHATLGPGPVDVPRWTAGVVGIALGLIVALCFVAAAGAAGG